MAGESAILAAWNWVWPHVSPRRMLTKYRRLRRKRLPGWAAGYRREPPDPNVQLVASGDGSPLAAGLWEVAGPRGEFSHRLDGSLTNLAVTRFPSEFPDWSLGDVPSYEQLPPGRYWALFYVWVGYDMKLACKVPFRVLDPNSKFWRWYERDVFQKIWERYFSGH